MQTHLIEQYHKIKNEHKDGIVFFQVGNFYQVYYYDAELLSEELSLKKTERSIGGRISVPMCGIPLQSIEKHIETLKNRGYHILVCRQIEEKGEIYRKISEDIFPETEVIDLTSLWEEYMATHQFLPKEKEKKKKKEDSLIVSLEKLELDRITPMEALQILSEWKKEFL